jgi:hypothetical protein
MRAQSGRARVVFHSISLSRTPSTGLGSILVCPMVYSRAPVRRRTSCPHRFLKGPLGIIRPCRVP